MLFCVDNSKTFCSNYSPPRDMKLLSLQMWANNMLPHWRKSLPKVPTKVKKKMMKTPPQALLKLSKSWWNKTAERLCWVCIGVQSQWMCSIMLVLSIVIQSLMY